MTYREIACAIHLHTTSSDGQGTMEDVVRAAKVEGIDATIITDHDTLGHNVNDWAGDVLVLTGEEITPDYSESVDSQGRVKATSTDNHIVAINLVEAVASTGRPTQALVDEVEEQGGLSFLAHPEDPGHPWRDRNVTGFTGLEVWNFKTAWKRGADLAPSRTYAWRNPDSILAPPAQEVMAWWDTLGRYRRVVGIGGSDNHASPTVIDGVERCLVPWHLGISAIVSRVWVHEEQFNKDPVHGVLEGLRAGRVIVSQDGLSKATGLRANMIDNAGEGQVRWPGEEFRLEHGGFLRVECPREALIRVLRDGATVSEKETSTLEYPVEDSGVWRVELELHGRAWAFTNPFYVR